VQPPRCSERLRRAPVRGDDARYEVSSYQRANREHPTPAAEPVGDHDAPTLEPDHDAFAGVTSLNQDPLTYNEAMRGPGTDKWLEAVAAELGSLQQMGVYDVVERPPDRKIIPTKWVFKTKRGPNGDIIRYKGRVVAKGYAQVPGLDYDETFAPVVKFTTIRTLLALAAHHDLEIHQLDIKTAFLHGELKEEIYAQCPQGFEHRPNEVWRLRKSIYGLKQASREWYAKVLALFLKLEFVRLNSDYAVFYKRANGRLIIIAVYVDDMLMFVNSLHHIKELKKQLASHFELTDLGEVRWILNMEIFRDRKRRTISLSQQQYVETILERHGMSECRPVSTPVATNTKLDKLEEAEVDTLQYQSQLGAVMYAMLGTRPDLAFAVQMLSQHAATPGEPHMGALKRVFRYLRKCTNTRLTFSGKDDSPELIGYVDADWANDSSD
jgi:Reverse transcriptase (RNA-dependent DNA polymerase)